MEFRFYMFYTRVNIVTNDCAARAVRKHYISYIFHTIVLKSKLLTRV